MPPFKRALWLTLLTTRHACLALDVVSPAPEAACAAVASATEIRQAIAQADEDYTSLCAAPDAGSEFSFANTSPLTIPESTSVDLQCRGRALQTHTSAGLVTLGEGATLTLHGCNWDSFEDDAASLDKNATAGESFPGVSSSAESVIHIKDSLMRLPCSMILGPPSALAQPTRVTGTGPLKQGTDPARGLPLPSAVTLLEAEYSLRSAAGAAAGAVRIRNMTVWCGASWMQAAPVAAAAIRAASEQLSAAQRSAGTPEAAAGAAAAQPPPPPPPSGASDDSRNFLIGTLAVACVAAMIVIAGACYIARRRIGCRGHGHDPHAFPPMSMSLPASPARASPGWWIHNAAGPQAADYKTHSNQSFVTGSSYIPIVPQSDGALYAGRGPGNWPSPPASTKDAVLYSPLRPSSLGAATFEPRASSSLGGATFDPRPTSSTLRGSPRGGGPSAEDSSTFTCRMLGGGSRMALISPKTPTSDAVTSTSPAGSAQTPVLHSGAGGPLAPGPGTPGSMHGASAGASAGTTSAAGGARGVGSLKHELANAVQQLQDALRADLQEEALEVFTLLGRGGFGTVYHGQWRGLPVAIKTLLFQSSDADNQTAKVASEVAIASNLVHHNIVATYSHDICHVSDASTCELDIYKFYLIQEFCNGGSLRTAVNKGLLTPPHMPQRWGPVISVLRDVAAGMNYMHAKRICHGDLNPSNILLKYDEVAHRSVGSSLVASAAVCKIADFGMARRMNRGKSHASGVRQGTPFYIAPEMVAHHQLHRSSDVYAFGVIMWEVMMGCSVYIAKPSHSRDSSLDCSADGGPSVAGAASGTPSGMTYARHPGYPHLPASVPLTYTLTMTACLSERPKDRPTFSHILVILEDLVQEVSRGAYINSDGNPQGSAMVQLMPTEAVQPLQMPRPEAPATAREPPALISPRDAIAAAARAPACADTPLTSPATSINNDDVFDATFDPIATLPSNSMPLSHSMLISGFKSTIQALSRPISIPEDSDESPSSTRSGALLDGIMATLPSQGPPSSQAMPSQQMPCASEVEASRRISEGLPADLASPRTASIALAAASGAPLTPRTSPRTSPPITATAPPGALPPRPAAPAAAAAATRSPRRHVFSAAPAAAPGSLVGGGLPRPAPPESTAQLAVIKDTDISGPVSDSSSVRTSEASSASLGHSDQDAHPVAASPPTPPGLESVLEPAAGASDSFFALPRHGVTETLTGSQMVTASEFVTALGDAAEVDAAAAHARARRHECNPSPCVWRQPQGGPAEAAGEVEGGSSPGGKCGDSRRSDGSDHNPAASLLCGDAPGLRSTTASSEAAAGGFGAAARGGPGNGGRWPHGARRGSDGAGGVDWGLVQSATTTAEEVSRLLVAGQTVHTTQ
eukprot:jgi/Ulvmu1/6640/UM003_0278.1